MKCPKCDGLMVFESFYDFQDDTGRNRFPGWRCLSCGKILDPLIEANRRKRVAPMVSKARQRGSKVFSTV
ncbi:MAG TPA: hypothetical protein VN944_00260 [Nitrospiria bacterium]|nr:hypothetical protein [Nitrospiria bacterium]